MTDEQKRYHDAVITGGHRLDQDEWRKLLDAAKRINDDEHHRLREHLFDARALTTFSRRSMEILPELHLAVSYRTILSLEVTMAELGMLAAEMERIGKDLTNEALRQKIQDTVKHVKDSIEKRKRPKLGVVP